MNRDMNENFEEQRHEARERVINAKNEVDRLTTLRNTGQVETGKAAEHREAEIAAEADLEAAKVHWWEVDPERAQHPDKSPYIYPF